MSVGVVNKQTGDRIPTAGMPAIDNTLSVISTNPVQNAIITAALAGKQDTLTFDDVPTDGSNNPVKSGGVKSAIDAVESGLNNANSNIASLFTNMHTAEAFQGGSVVKYVVLGKVVAFYANITKDQDSWTVAYGLPKPYADGLVGYLEDNYEATWPVFIFKDTSDGRLQVRSSSTSIENKPIFGIYVTE